MFKRLVVSLALVLPAMALPSQVASAQGPAVGTEAAELLAERPAGEDTLVVVETTTSGRPRVLVQDGIDTRAEAERVLIAADRLRGETVVEWDGTATIAGSPDPRRPEQWGHDAVGAEAAWTAATGSGVVVAVLDTGIVAHPDLAGRVLQGRDFIDGDTNPVDGHGHGTHVAGIIAAVANNGIGIAGAAPDALILPVRVLNDGGSGSFSTVATAITWSVDNGADVINMSLGGSTRSAAVTQAIDYARSRNVVVVAAAGNSGPGGAISWPGAEPGALGVAATTSWGEVASFSTRGDYVDVAAPGDRILSTLNTGDYGLMSGTSMASPYVAALAALVIQANPGWAELSVRNHIIATSQDIAPAGFDDASGNGGVSFAAAVPPAAWGAPAPATVTAARSGVDTVVTASAVTHSGVTGYEFYKNGSLAATSATPTWTDTNAALTAGAVTYGVRATGTFSRVGATRETVHTVTVPAAPSVTHTVSGTTVTVTPAAGVGETPTQWLGYRNGALISTVPSTGRRGATNSITYSSQPFGTYTYTVRAASATGVSAPSSAIVLDLLPAAPSTVTATRAGLDILVNVSRTSGIIEFLRNGVVVQSGSSRTYTDVGAAVASPREIVYSVRSVIDGVTGHERSTTYVLTTPATPVINGYSVSGGDLVLNVTAPGATQLMVYRENDLYSTVTAASTVTVPGMGLSGYAWRVRAASATGVSGYSNTMNVAGGVSAPASVTVTRSGPDLVVTAAAVVGATRYELWRNGALVSWRSSQPSWTDAGQAGVVGTHTYAVRAVTSDLRRSNPTAASWTVSAIAAPTITDASVVGTTVTLRVSAPGATEVLVYRNGELVAANPGGGGVITLANQAFGVSQYTVRGTTATSMSAPSAARTLTVTVTPTLSAVVSGTAVLLTATPVAGATRYEFRRNGMIISSRGSTFSDANIAMNMGTYTYSVQAINSAGERTGTGTAVIALLPPPAPTVTAELGSNRRVTLTISAVPGAQEYLIYRNGRLLSSATAAGAITLTRQPIGENNYTVRAVTARGASGLSAGAAVIVS